MIKRGPKPTRDFLILRNEVARDRKLSFLARGLLASILSRPNNWKFSAERLAAETDKEGVKAIRTALRELEAAGYLERSRVQDPETGKWSWDQVFYDMARTSTATISGVCAGQPESPSPTIGSGSIGEGTSKEVPRPITMNKEVNELSGSTFGRFAPFGGGDSEPEEAGNDETDEGRLTVDDFVDWRAEDREVFDEHIGTVLRSYGGEYKEGRFQAPQFYDLFQKMQNIKWPGRYLARLEEVAPDGGIDNWLANLGLERVT